MVAVLAVLTKIVLAVLLGLSIWSVSIIVDRRRAIKQIADHDLQAQLKFAISEGQKAVLSKVPSGNPGIRVETLHVLVSSNQTPESVAYAMQGFLTEKRLHLSKGLSVLATLGSNAPFIGLFGTVLGIIQAFGSLANEPSAVGGVMAAISEALIATAVGLFVAIPAVVAFNYFSSKIREDLGECEALRDFYISKFLGAKS